jgi:uncharacterized DUF497 family protein
VQFEWDEQKNKANIAKHGISFEKAKGVFEGRTLTTIDGRYDYGELREISLGLVDGVLILAVVHTATITGKIRLISARKANKQERQRYEKTLR